MTVPPGIVAAQGTVADASSAGFTTIAVGHLEPDGRLSAFAVLSGRPGIVDVKGCSPAAVDDAMTTALVSGG